VEEPHFAERVIEDFVRPIYLSVRMTSPLDPVQGLLVAEKAHQASADEVLWMLATYWRPRRVGAWFALVHREPEIDLALLESLRTSRGYLTAPDLGFAAARRLGRDALPALHEYQAIALRDELGGLSTITALIESLGDSSEIADSTDRDLESLLNRRAWAEFIEKV
jgi:hypothetical protein